MCWEASKEGITVYSEPPGFVTLTAHGQPYWVISDRIDTVNNIIEGDKEKGIPPRLLIDPYYYEMAQGDPSFEAFLDAQGFRDHVELIDSEDITLNLANFTVMPTPEGKTIMVFNGASKTVQRLNISVDKYRELNVPLMRTAYGLGLQRCLTQLIPKLEIRHKSFNKINIDEIAFEGVGKGMIPKMISNLLQRQRPDLNVLLKRLRSLKLQRLSIDLGTPHGTALDFRDIPSRSTIYLSAAILETEIAAEIVHYLGELADRLDAMWAVPQIVSRSPQRST